MPNAYDELSSAEKDTLWKGALFVIDTNVLLQLYDATETTAARQIEALEAIKSRLWIPHQVAHEYWLQRRDRAYDKIRTAQSFTDDYRGFENTLKQRVNNLLAGVDSANQLATSLAEHLKAAEPLLSDIISSARRQAKTVSDFVSTILERSVGPRPQVGELKAYALEVEERFRLVRGPGYRDVDKAGYLRWMGDTLIWLQTLSQAKATNKPVILCTNDSKDDWWFKTRGDNGEQLYLPHPSLVDEFRDYIGQTFLMYRSSEFYKELQRRKLAKPVANKAVSRELDDAFFRTYTLHGVVPTVGGSMESASSAALRAWLAGFGDHFQSENYDEVLEKSYTDFNLQHLSSYNAFRELAKHYDEVSKERRAQRGEADEKKDS